MGGVAPEKGATPCHYLLIHVSVLNSLSTAAYKKQDWFAMSLVVSDDGTVTSEEGAAWTIADISGGGGLCDPYSSTAADVFGSGALYSAAQSLEGYYWTALCAYSDSVKQEYSWK